MSGVINAQSIITGNINTFVDSLITAMPDSFGVDKNKYLTPSASDRTNFATVVTNIINQQYSTANTNASLFGFQVIEYRDNSVSPTKSYYVILKTSASTNYWGTFIFNPAAERRRLIIQSPHPLYDTYTGAQGFHIFKTVGARAFFISGAHRCNSNSASTCDGTTTVCTGSSANYRISDQAHTTESFMQRGTETLEGLISNLIVIQVHGFGKLDTDPDIIMSNGTAHTPAGTDYVIQLKNNLLAEDNTLTFKIPHIDIGWSRLNGTTNTQGRYINGSGDPCETSPGSTNSRFIHVEQKRDGLRNPSSNWSKLTNAIANTFGLDPLPVTLISFSANLKEEKVYLSWQTATEVNNYGFNVERRTKSEEWHKIAFVQGSGNSNSLKSYGYTDNLAHALGLAHLQYRLKQIDFDGVYEYSKVVDVRIETPSEFKLEQNYPNPFNPSTEIGYRIPETGRVTLKIYDVLGREVATLLEEVKEPGVYKSTFSALGSSFSSGVYFYRVQAGSYSQTKKMLLIK